jgi:hypothetical protein
MYGRRGTFPLREFLHLILAAHECTSPAQDNAMGDACQTSIVCDSPTALPGLSDRGERRWGLASPLHHPGSY